MRATRLWFGALLAGLATTAAPRNASACGGTFCDSGPNAMPVDQTGENVIFVLDDGFVEAHVQIQYQGDPTRFAWIVPMQKVPETTVGSAALFANTLAATVPSYGFTSSFDQCSMRRAAKTSFDTAGGNSIGVDAGAPGVSVAYRKSVGAFEVTALSGGSAEEVVTWLSMNGYQNVEAAPAILQRYIDEKFVFVAVKLTAGASTDEIHPLVFRYEGSEPCVPLELTSVAAVDDMNVRTFFFGSERIVPANYRHVVLNPVRIDWLNLGANYPDVVARAVDAKGADGQAFVTEYAGTSSRVSSNFVDSRWNASRFRTLVVEQLSAELTDQGLADCSSGECVFMHPMILPILEEFLPAPAGVNPARYYACPQCMTGGKSPEWDAAGFARAVDERIVLPASHATSIAREHPYLTRLYTRISPDEMTLDPIFRPQPNLGDVALPGTATNRRMCNQATVMTLPTGEQVAMGKTGVWPKFNDMPYAARIEDFSTGAPKPTLVADNEPQIQSSLSASNEGFGYGDAGCGCALANRGTPARGLTLLGAGLGVLVARRRRQRQAKVKTRKDT
jgi:hypothetical protein